MSDTPRTDAMIQPVPGKDCVTGEPIDVVHADDCRKLERELARTDELLAHYTYAAPQANKADVGACGHPVFQPPIPTSGGLPNNPAVAAPSMPPTGPSGRQWTDSDFLDQALTNATGSILSQYAADVIRKRAIELRLAATGGRE